MTTSTGQQNESEQEVDIQEKEETRTSKLGVGVHASNPGAWRLRREERFEFKARLSYIVSSRQTQASISNLVSENTKTKKCMVPMCLRVYFCRRVRMCTSVSMFAHACMAGSR